MIKQLMYLLVPGLMIVSACNDAPAPTPKPRGYPKIEFPERAYQSFDEDYCNFTFEYPIYTKIQQDTNFFESRPVHPCWFDVYFPSFDGRIHCSYYPIGEGKSFETLKADAFELADWHHKKANYVDELPIAIPERNVSGFLFAIEGPAASPLQFFLTDSTQHFLRGALYFNTKARPDSLAPVYNFVRDDVMKMIETFEWVEQEL
jgi:gliding motility-associated lipoprotein GldD